MILLMFIKNEANNYSFFYENLTIQYQFLNFNFGINYSFISIFLQAKLFISFLNCLDITLQKVSHYIRFSKMIFSLKIKTSLSQWLTDLYHLVLH